MAKDTHRVGNGILGDIDPAPEPESPHSGESVRDHGDNDSSMQGGSRHDRTEHSGSRDVTEGVTGDQSRPRSLRSARRSRLSGAFGGVTAAR